MKSNQWRSDLAAVAVEEVFPHSLRQRCLAHKTRNVLDKIPDSNRAALKAMIQAGNYTPNREVAAVLAAEVLEALQSQYPSAMRSF